MGSASRRLSECPRAFPSCLGLAAQPTAHPPASAMLRYHVDCSAPFAPAKKSAYARHCVSPSQGHRSLHAPGPVYRRRAGGGHCQQAIQKNTPLLPPCLQRRDSTSDFLSRASDRAATTRSVKHRMPQQVQQKKPVVHVRIVHAPLSLKACICTGDGAAPAVAHVEEE
jgi:hypothetical protein